MLLRRDVLTGLSVFFPPLLRHKTAYASLGSKQPCRHVVEFRPTQEDEAGKREKRGPMTVTHLHVVDVVDVVAIPLLCVLCFWHILKIIEASVQSASFLPSFASFCTLQNSTKLYNAYTNYTNPHGTCRTTCVWFAVESFRSIPKSVAPSTAHAV